MQANIITLNGVAISWQTDIQQGVSTDSTDGKIKALNKTCKRTVAFQHFLSSAQLGDSVNTKFLIFADNIALIGLIKSNGLTVWSRHYNIPMAFSYENYLLQYYDIHHIASKLNTVDFLTKTLIGPIHARHCDFLCGFRFYPTDSTEHGYYLHYIDRAIKTLATGKLSSKFFYFLCSDKSDEGNPCS